MENKFKKMLAVVATLGTFSGVYASEDMGYGKEFDIFPIDLNPDSWKTRQTLNRAGAFQQIQNPPHHLDLWLNPYPQDTKPFNVLDPGSYETALSSKENCKALLVTVQIT